MIFILDLHFLYSRSSRRHHLRCHNLLHHLRPLFRHLQKASHQHPLAHSPRAPRQPCPSATSARCRSSPSSGAAAASRCRRLNVWCLDI
jgi:hypothetical protein